MPAYANECSNNPCLPGTDGDIRKGERSVITDYRSPYPWGIYVQGKDEFDLAYRHEHHVRVNMGPGTTGVSLASHRHTTYLVGESPGYFIACQRVVSYHNLTVVRYVYHDTDNFPSDCTIITLVSECNMLAGIPGGTPEQAFSSHE
jgi:hypothetical protein